MAASATGKDDGAAIDFSIYTQQRNQESVLVGSRHRMDFVGSSTGPDYSTKAQPCNYAMGLYNKTTGLLQLVPIQAGRVIRMDVRLHGLDYGASEASAAAGEGNTREEKLALSKRLVDSFGSTRRRRQLVAREEGVVRTNKLGNPDALTKELGKKSDEAERLGITRDKVMQTIVTVRNLPPHHLDAITFAEAYVFNEVIPVGAMVNLQEHYLLEAANQNHGMESLRQLHPPLPQYVLGRLHLLRDPNQAVARQRACLLSFLCALFQLVTARPSIRVNSGPGGLDIIARNFGMHRDLLQELLDLFYIRGLDQEGREIYERPDHRKELIIAYILVSAQLLESGCALQGTEFEALRMELKMQRQDLLQRFREVGSACSSTTIVEEDGEGRGGRIQSYNVQGFKDGKTLGQSFPLLISGKRK